MQAGQHGNCKEGKMEDKNDRVFDESGSTIDVKKFHLCGWMLSDL